MGLSKRFFVSTPAKHVATTTLKCHQNFNSNIRRSRFSSTPCRLENSLEEIINPRRRRSWKRFFFFRVNKRRGRFRRDGTCTIHHIQVTSSNFPFWWSRLEKSTDLFLSTCAILSLSVSWRPKPHVSHPVDTVHCFSAIPRTVITRKVGRITKATRLLAIVVSSESKKKENNNSSNKN